jgi:hypothetical protein
MRVITFSRYFPVKHPRKGEPTYFVEKIWAGLADITDRMQGNVDMDWHEYYNGVPKWHTIRAGNRWKVGDFFSPRFWSDKPYRSKQSLITEPIEIKKIWDFEKDEHGFYFVNGSNTNLDVDVVAKNDGLSREDFDSWFYFVGKSKNGFKGQILCWNENINY